jgi:molybdenum cofactor biosynthesis MoaF-like protein
MTPESKKDSEFISYPTNRVVGTINDSADAQAAIEELIEAGFSTDEIDVIYGEQGMRRLDPTGEKHGLLARLQRTFLQLNEEPKHLTHHVEDVLAGHFVIMVLADEPEKQARAGEILKSHGGHFINFYGRWAMQSLDASESMTKARVEDEGGLPAVGHNYEANFDGRNFQIRFESGGMLIVTDSAQKRSQTVQVPATEIRSGVFMISWQEANKTTLVWVLDLENGIVYSNTLQPDGTFLLSKGTLKRLP